MTDSISSVVLIGAGNVATHLGHIFSENGIPVPQVFSRKKEKSKKLAEKLNAEYTNQLSSVFPNADVYILAVHDDAIKDVAEQLIKNGLSKKLIVHTSGATPQTVFSSTGAKRYGTFYPLQTFSPGSIPDFNDIPICVDANSKTDLTALQALAKKISPKVYQISDEERAVLHVAAVFANNFSNHLFHAASDILAKNNLPFELLLPLINETVNKLEKGTPSEMQTGPARRKDEETINKHLDYLTNFPQYKKLYELLTEGIKKQNEKQ